MLFSGTRFCPPGPEKLDWTINLAEGTFGPLGLGSTADEIKAALGRPHNGQFFGVGRTLVYRRFSLYLSLDAIQHIQSLEISIDEREDEDYKIGSKSVQSPSPFENPFYASQFDPDVRLPGTNSRARQAPGD